MASFDSMPLWGIGVLAVVWLSVVIECGYRLGSRMALGLGSSKHPIESAVCSSLLGLMAFMMAFTFGAAVTRYSKVRSLALADANVAGNLMLVTDTLPEAQAEQTRKLLREYVEVRAAAVRDQDMVQLEAAINRSKEIQHELWQIGNEIRRSEGDASLRLYTSGVLELIENDATRQTTAFYNRLPPIIWIVFGFLATLAFLVLGLSSGLHGRRSPLVGTMLVVAYSLVFLLIVDLDRPFRMLFDQGDHAAAHVLKRMF